MKKKTKKSSSLNKLTYKGTISIKLADGNRVYYETTIHNTGCPTLFNFLTDCLKGDFTIAKASRPCKLVLFAADNSELDSNEEFKSDATLIWTDATSVSTAIYYDSAATPGKTETGSTVTFHFRVPYLCLVDGAVVRKLALIPENAIDYTRDMCAYHLLEKSNAIKIPTGGSNFTVIVDWTLQITNA